MKIYSNLHESANTITSLQHDIHMYLVGPDYLMHSDSEEPSGYK